MYVDYIAINITSAFSLVNIFFLAGTSGSQITSNRQFEERTVACLNLSVTFMCRLTDTLQLDWIVEPSIPSTDPLRFFSDSTVGLSDTRGQFTGTLTSSTPSLSDAQRANMTSTLSSVATSSLNRSLIECHSDTSRVVDVLQITGIMLRRLLLCCTLPLW